jgi:hypothetical protein
MPLSARGGNSSVAALQQAIIRAAHSCTQALFNQVHVHEMFGERTREAEMKLIEVYLRFIYFFLHMTSRMALGKGGPGREKGGKLLNMLCASVAEELFSEVFQKQEFLDRLNQAELEYSNCTQLIGGGGLMEAIATGGTLKGLIDQLAWNVGKDLGPWLDVILLELTKHATMEVLDRMELGKLVQAAGREI